METPADPSDQSVTVVIATRDRPELLRRAIDGIAAQRHAGDIEVVEVLTNDDNVPRVLVVSGYLDIEDDTLSLDHLEKCVEKANGSRTRQLLL